MRRVVFAVIFALLPLVVFAEEAQKAPEIFYFFYSESCPHCHEAMPFVDTLEKENPDIKFKRLEVSKDEVNLALFNKKVAELKIENVGVPVFIFNGKFIVGYKKDVFEARIREMIETGKVKTDAAQPEKNIDPKKSEEPGKVEKTDKVEEADKVEKPKKAEEPEKTKKPAKKK